MRILILYGTSEGQTRKIASFMADRLRRVGHETVLVDAARLPDRLAPREFDAALVASRVHAGRHLPAVEHFAHKHRAELDAMPNAFVSVSMSAAGQEPGDLEHAGQYLHGFVEHTGWHPHQVHLAAGARLYTHHNRLARWILSIVDRHRFDTRRDHEWTDWRALERFVDDWGHSASLEGAGAPAAAAAAPARAL